MRKEISISTIQRWQNAINELITLIDTQKGNVGSSDIQVVIKNNKISKHLTKVAIDLGYINKISKNKYSVNLKNCEPIHARKAIEAQREIFISKYGATGSKNYKNSKQQKVKQLIQTNRKQSNKKQRQISLFWGFIKIYY
jgi:hypothetical protein